MTVKSGPPPIVYILLILLLGAGGWFAYKKGLIPGGGSKTPTTPVVTTPVTPSLPSLDTSLPNPTQIVADGSVSMVQLMVGLKALYTQKYPNIGFSYGVPDGTPNGSSKGIEGISNGIVQLAASSRPLRSSEQQSGLQAIPVAKDAVAVVVGVNNPFKGGLTLEQLAQIFTGKITNWSEVGGPSAPIKVINRAATGGTQEFFREIVLLGKNFAADGPNFTTMATDSTTPILQRLGTDGISYATASQVKNQATVRIVPINGSSAADPAAIQNGSYPISRSLFLVVPSKTSQAVKDFIDLALSPEGQQVVSRAELVPIQ
jgi:phosphate transport system substrate-binding protein